jgi:outer membrane protein assembly factor BamB
MSVMKGYVVKMGLFSKLEKDKEKTTWHRSFNPIRASILVLLVMLTAASMGMSERVGYAAGIANWSTYMGGNQHSDFSGAETAFQGIASALKLHWKFTAKGAISAQPVVVNGVVYFGAWDGNEYAVDLNGRELWHQYLGKVTPKHCSPASAGVAGTATVAVINGVQTVLVGGGDANFYALNAANGSIIWKQNMGPSPSTMIWAGATYYNGNVYLGVASYGDCPLVQGRLVEMNATNGAIIHTYYAVPNGCQGGGIWDAPTIDPTIGNGGTVYFTTGTITNCKVGYESQAVAFVAVNANDLSVIGSWQVPKAQQIGDGDFGTTPTLFGATIGGQLHQMVGVVNKNGYYYAFDRTRMGSNPLWEKQISIAPNNIASAAWDGTSLYVAGSKTNVGGKACAGSVRAVNPADGSYRWEYCAPTKVIGGPMVVPGVVIVGATRFLKVLDAASGKELFSFFDPSIGASFWGSATVVNNVLYIGDSKGNLFALGQ